MDKNDYGYGPEKNIILAMFDDRFSTYDGLQPNIKGTCGITSDPFTNIKNSLKIGTNSCLSFKRSEIALGMSDFTLDFWMRYQGDYSGISSATINGRNGIAVQPDMAWIGNNHPTLTMLNGSFKPRIWAHYAYVRKGNSLYWFIDGVQKGYRASSSAGVNSDILTVNARYNNGLISKAEANYKAVRLCDFARWTSNFIVPDVQLKSSKFLYLKENEIYGIQP